MPVSPQQLMAYLTGTLGYSAHQAAALVGNMRQESSLNPIDLNRKEGAFGLLNWRGDRLGNLQQFAAQQGKPITDWQTQLDFVKHEMSGPEAGNAAGFLGAQTLQDANAGLKPYVRYGDNSQGTRLNYAQQAIQPTSAPVPPASVASNFYAAPGRSPDLQRVNPQLIQAVQQGATTLPPGYAVQINEGFNEQGHTAGSQHHIPGSGALDVQIVDQHGNVIANRGQDTTGLYTQLAKGSYQAAQQLGVGDKFAWGGRFGTVSGGNVPDLMHFDLGGDRGHFLSPLAEMFGGNTQVAATPIVQATQSPNALSNAIGSQQRLAAPGASAPLPIGRPAQSAGILEPSQPALQPTNFADRFAGEQQAPSTPADNRMASFDERFSGGQQQKLASFDERFSGGPTQLAGLGRPQQPAGLLDRSAIQPAVATAADTIGGDQTYGHSPEAIAAAKREGIWDIPQGQTIKGQPWNFPTMNPMATEPRTMTAQNMQPEGLLNPGTGFPNPMTVAGIPGGSTASLAGGPIQMANFPAAMPQTQIAGIPDMSPAPMQQAGGGLMGSGGGGLMGGMGGGGLGAAFSALANLGGGQSAPPAPQMAPNPTPQIAAAMPPPDLTQLKGLLAAYRARGLIA